jgi:hypothetical protein
MFTREQIAHLSLGLEVNRSATVTAFSTDLDCQPGYISNATMYTSPMVWQVTAAFSNSVCTTEQVLLGEHLENSRGETGYIGTSVMVAYGVDGEGQPDGYLIVASAQVAAPANSTSYPNNILEASKHRVIQMGSFELNSTVLFCKPLQKLENALVYLNSSNSILSISTNGIAKSLTLSDMDLVEAFNNSLLAASNAFIATSAIVGRTDSSSHDVLFQVLIAISSEKDASRYMDVRNLEADTRKLFTATWTQLANQHLLSEGSYEIGTGTYCATELRLILRPVTLYLLDGGLLALAICTSIMFFVRTTITGISDLPTLGRVATILAADPELANIGSRESLTRLNSGFSYSVASQVAQETDDASVTDYSPGHLTVSQLNQTLVYWRPLAMSRWLHIVVLALPVAAVSTIEATYQISAKQQGLGDILEHEYLHYTWTLVPALIMTLVKLLGQTIAFSIQLLDSYVLLRLANRPENQTLFVDRLSGNSLSRCYHSIRSKRFAVTSISLVTLLSPFLTIVISGLFGPQSVPQFGNTTLDVADRLDDVPIRGCL